MKILFTVENYYPMMSGVPNVVKYLAEDLANKGNEVTVVTRHIDGCKDEEVLNSVKIVRKNIYYTKTKGFGGDTTDYIEFVKNFECDVIIFQCSQCITTDLLLPHLEKIDKIKLFHSHGFSGLTLKPIKICSNIKHTLGNSYNWIRWNLYYNIKFKKYVKQFDATICLSEVDSSKEYLEKNSNKIYILSNAADDMFFDSTIMESKIDKYTNLINKKYIISIANYQEYKNQIGILNEYYRANLENYDLVFIGSEKNEYYKSLLKEYKKLKNIYGEKPVHFLTNVERCDIPQILRDAKLYLVGSSFEEFSISLIEAMAVGVPFVSTNVGNACILPGGITIDKISDMSNSINILLNDNLKYEQLKNNGMIYSKNFCKIETVTNRLIDIINECKK